MVNNGNDLGIDVSKMPGNLTDDKVRIMKKFLTKGVSKEVIARIFKINYTNVEDIDNRRIWKHVKI